MRVKFEEVQITGHKVVKCDGGCGRRLNRQRKFWQTLSPFNKNQRGISKTREEILSELRKEVAQWRVLPETCAACSA